MVTKKAPKVRRKVVLDKLLHGKKAAPKPAPLGVAVSPGTPGAKFSQGQYRAPALGSDPFAKPMTRSTAEPPADMRTRGLIPVHARLEAGIMRRIDALASRLDTRRSWGRTTRSEALRNALVAGLDALEAKERAQ
jgi:hypothetical protein